MHSSSPERPSVKITYAGKSKRQRPFAHDSISPAPNTTHDRAEANVASQDAIKREKLPSSSKKSAMKRRTSLSQSPKAQRPPPPSPKDTKAMPPPTELPNSPRSRKLSTSSLNQTSCPPRSSSRAPLSEADSAPSIITPKSPPVSNTEASAADDDRTSVGQSSVGESSKTLRKRYEPERIAYLKDQPTYAPVSPHKALCTKCGKVISLGTNQTYAIRPWVTHRKKCDGADYKEDEDGDDASGFPPPPPPPSQPKQNVDERKATLEADPRAAEVRAETVLCKKCNKWIKLTKGRQYVLRHWNEHQSRCDIQPSERVAAAERKLQLVNDSQVKYFTGELVQCATCGITVQLQGVEYDLTEWIKHKGLNCGNRPSDNGEDAGSLDQQNTLPFPSTRPPPSSSSTDGTLIATGPSSGPCELSPTHGVKRAREEEEEEAEASDNEQPDRRPSNRQRDDEYTPEEREPPSVLGWFMLPFAAFVRGFRESLGSRNTYDYHLNSHPRSPHLQRIQPAVERGLEEGLDIVAETVCVPLIVSDELKSGPRPRSKGSSRSSMSRDDIGSSLTPAERAREKRLRDDPMADVIGPLFVDCRRCGARIKLSPKSVYDPFHWKTHKERCLKKPIGALVTKKANSQRTGTPQLVNELPSAAHTPVSPKPDTTVSTTPPLTPDKDDGPPAQRDSESNDQYFPPPPPTRDPALLITRLERSQDNWQKWDWSQLKSPDFNVNDDGAGETGKAATVSTISAGGVLPGEESLSPRELQLRRDAIFSLNLLSQSAPRPLT
ncbi:hypothetical protein EYR38_008625 [Pleurotus pulmonarius]|nr:hypothetical protein EYR38_008625 [Pleurotus pulmonarius]